MPAVVLVGAQWGDEGKGKATDLLGSRLDYVVKFNGGNNAGHTVVVGDEKYALHLLPSGILTPGVTPVIENILRASARAQKATGVPISTHTWAAGRTGLAQQAIFAQEGVDLGRVIIGHSGDSDDLGYLRGLMERGSTIGMDRFGLEHFLPTAKRVEVIARLCAEGYAPRMVLSHDANCWSDMLSEEDKRRTRPLWHYNHIPDDILPALRKAGVSQDHIDQMLVRNPRAIFEARRSESVSGRPPGSP